MIVLTPTGGRFQSFALCEQWMARQSFSPDEWIVVDDGAEPTPCTMDQRVIRLPPRPGEHTLARNIAAGLEGVTGKVCVIEDDDWYASHYLAAMDQWLDDADLAGEGNALYYRPDIPGWRHMNNRGHASMAATGLKGDAVGFLRGLCRRMIGKQFLDMTLWRDFLGSKRVHDYAGLLVQIKGGPGRRGASQFHRRADGWAPDPDGAFLRSLMGDEADAYLV